MPKTKLIHLLSNIAILSNLVVGFLQIHWAIIIVFIIIHTLLRLAYVKADRHNTTQNNIAPPAITTIASVITAVILALVIYGIGYGMAFFIK